MLRKWQQSVEDEETSGEEVVVEEETIEVGEVKTKPHKRTQEVKDTLLTLLGIAVRPIGSIMRPPGNVKLQQPAQ